MKKNLIRLVMLWFVICQAVMAAPSGANPLRVDNSVEHLDGVLDDAGYWLARGERPVIIMDLDDTIFDAGSRTLSIFGDLAHDPNFAEDLPDLHDTMDGLSADDMKYEIEDNLDLLGIHGDPLRQRVIEYWTERFFRLCDRDEIHRGALDFVLSAHQSGAHVVYLTGRDKVRMAGCTTRALRKHGLPNGVRATLMLKPSESMADVDFKKQAFAKIGRLGQVIAAFDNEPANVNAMAEAFPGAEVFFVKTRHSKRPDRPLNSIEQIVWPEEYP